MSSSNRKSQHLSRLDPANLPIPTLQTISSQYSYEPQTIVPTTSLQKQDKQRFFCMNGQDYRKYRNQLSKQLQKNKIDNYTQKTYYLSQGFNKFHQLQLQVLKNSKVDFLKIEQNEQNQQKYCQNKKEKIQYEQLEEENANKYPIIDQSQTKHHNSNNQMNLINYNNNLNPIQKSPNQSTNCQTLSVAINIPKPSPKFINELTPNQRIQITNQIRMNLSLCRQNLIKSQQRIDILRNMYHIRFLKQQQNLNNNNKYQLNKYEEELMKSMEKKIQKIIKDDQ